MYLQRLEVRNLRNLISVSISPSPGLNIIEGANGSGKTSLLEAIHLLGLARSFRTIKTRNIVQHGHNSLILFSEIIANEHHHRLGLQRFRDNQIQIRLDGQNLQRRGQLANLLPLQVITPESISLLAGAPVTRRQYLDWAMFHVEQSFQDTWSQYERALKQRNSILRQSTQRDIQPWDEIVSTTGEQLDRLRTKTAKAIIPFIKRYIDVLLPAIEIDLTYRSGWKQSVTLSEALKESIHQDSKNGYTSVGPHRADITIRTKGIPVSECLSRGQLKLLVCALRLGQMAYLEAKTGRASLVLLDDLPAELDEQHRCLLLKLLHELHCQVFVTATDRLQVSNDEWQDVKVFHVEHGEIEEVV